MYIKITGLVVTVVLIIQNVYTMKSVVTSRYVVQGNTRANVTPDTFVNTPSAIVCAGVCRSSNGCTAANYHTIEKKCQLLFKACFLNETIFGWSLIKIQPPQKEFVYISDRTESWDGAKTYCNSIGGQLANIRTTSEHTGIINSVTTIPDPPSVWIGGSDQGSEGEWYWSDGCLFGDQDFNFWGPNQPNNYLEDQHCLGIYNWVNDGGFAWDDDKCTLAYTFICEILT